METPSWDTPPGCVRAIWPRRRVMECWPPQSHNLNHIEIVWDELDCRVKEKQPTSAQHMWDLLQGCWKSIPGEAGWENAKSVKSWRISKQKYIYISLTLFWLLHDSLMCYFIVLMSSLLFYNVEHSTNNEKPLNQYSRCFQTFDRYCIFNPFYSCWFVTLELPLHTSSIGFQIITYISC